MIDELIIGDIDIGSDNKIQISLRQFKGREYVDIRKFRQFNYEPDYTPTRKGVTIPLARLLEIINLLEEAKDHFEEHNEKRVLIEEEALRIEREE